MLTAERYLSRRLQNLLHSVLLVGAMLGLLALLGWILGGRSGLLMLLLVGATLALLTPTLSPQLILRMYRARQLGAAEAPGLVRLVAELARRAELPRAPRLFYVPSPICNAFAVGSRNNAIIGVTDCMLRRFGPRELAGVIAHEISHIRHNDLWVMGLADLVSRATRALSLMGQFLLFVNLPLMMIGKVVVPWTLVVVLILTPTVAALLQLALSRTREFDADLEAARLTGDPRGLASTLARMERIRAGLLARILFPDRGNPEPSLLRTHPTTEERVRRLLELNGQRLPPEVQHAPGPVVHLGQLPTVRARAPRWHISGLWY